MLLEIKMIQEMYKGKCKFRPRADHEGQKGSRGVALLFRKLRR